MFFITKYSQMAISFDKLWNISFDNFWKIFPTFVGLSVWFFMFSMDIELDNFCFHFEYFPTNVSTGWIENHAIWCLIKMMFFYCNWTATRSKKRLQLVYLVISSINSKFAIQNAFLRQPLQTYLKPFYIVFVASCNLQDT